MYYVIFIRLFIALKLANVNSRNVAALRVLMFGGQVAEIYISFGSTECHDRMQYRYVSGIQPTYGGFVGYPIQLHVGGTLFRSSLPTEQSAHDPGFVGLCCG